MAGAALALFFGLFSLTQFSHRLEHQYGLGVLFSLRGPLAPPSGAVIVAVDNATISWLREISDASADALPPSLACLPRRSLDALSQVRGPGGLPRSLHACLLRELERLSAPVVVFDILFSVRGDPVDDAIFERALRSHGATAILAGFGRSALGAGDAELIVDKQVPPLAAFRESAAGTGSFLVPSTSGPVYGYWRKIPGFGGVGALPDTAVALRTGSAAASGAPAESFEYLWYYGPAGSIPTVSMRDVLAGEIADPMLAAIADTAVFIGASDPRTSNFPDSFSSFYSSRITDDVSGVELAATAFLNLLAGDRLHRLPPPLEVALVALFAFGMSMVALSRRRAAAPLVAAGALVYCFAAVAAFSRSYLILPMTTPVFVAAPAIMLVAILSRYRFARALAMRLAPAPVARRMLAQAVDLRRTATSNEATVVFCDVIGSSAIAEQVSELEFSELLSAYYDAVSREVEAHDGFVSSFSGDGVVALFRVSDAGPEHAAQACRAMIAAVRGMHDLNAENAERGRPPIGLRIGVNSGRVAEGEIGARDRFNFSVVGDVVNLAARLEQLGKTLFPGETDVILIGASTGQAARRHGFALLDCGPQPIPGRRTKETVFRLLLDRDR